MLSGYSKVVIFSKGMMNNRAIRYFWGDKLCYASDEYGDTPCFIGWGNKANTSKARGIAAQKKIPFIQLEDGFIRSVGLGVQGAASFSIVTDDLGIYYDATKPSRLEKILTEYDFAGDRTLDQQAAQAIDLIKELKISKYNATHDQAGAEIAESHRRKILVIAQTAGDMSLEYGHANQFSTKAIIDSAFEENPDADVYLKIHPDVSAGKKRSDLAPDQVPQKCRVITRNVNPISLLEKIDKVYTKTSQMGFEALLLGKECACFGMPFYAGWGLTDDRMTCSRRTRKLTVNQVFAGAYILYSRYYNPYIDQEADIIDTLHTIKKYRDIDMVNGSSLLFHGFSHRNTTDHRHFFKSGQNNSLSFCHTTKQIETLAKKSPVKLFVWGRPANGELENLIDTYSIKRYFVADGLLRWLPFDFDLARSHSLVVDSRGLYVDASQESDLEYIYNTYDFKSHTGLLERAGKIIETICAGEPLQLHDAPPLVPTVDRHAFDKIILVPGQVADHASIRLGGMGVTNSTLLEMVRESNPASYIVYKPHPEVVTGNGKGALAESFARRYCDRIVSEISMGTCIAWADEIHTITSFSGFDAILRDKKVVTYGMPFYAGWGLTEDHQTCDRRKRSVSKEELVAGALLLYPRYIHPATKELCEIEQVLKEGQRQQERCERSAIYRQAKRLSTLTTAASRKIIAKAKRTDAVDNS